MSSPGGPLHKHTLTQATPLQDLPPSHLQEVPGDRKTKTMEKKQKHKGNEKQDYLFGGSQQKQARDKSRDVNIYSVYGITELHLAWKTAEEGCERHGAGGGGERGEGSSRMVTTGLG